MTTREREYKQSEEYKASMPTRFVLNFVRSEVDPAELLDQEPIASWSQETYAEVYALTSSLLENQTGDSEKTARLNLLKREVTPYLDDSSKITPEKIAYCARIDGASLIMVPPSASKERNDVRLRRLKKAQEMCGKCAVVSTCLKLGESQAHKGEVWGDHFKKENGQLVPLSGEIARLSEKLRIT